MWTVIVVIAAGGLGWIGSALIARDRQVRQCENCEIVKRDADKMLAEDEEEDCTVLSPAVRAAIAEAAGALVHADATSETIEDLAYGPRVWVDLDVISEIESGGNDQAVGRDGERGRYQITEGAWRDTLTWLRRNRGWQKTWNWWTDAPDAARARVIAGTYVNYVLPQWLTCRRLDKEDTTGPIPDSLCARVAAYNCGAKRVRQAYALCHAKVNDPSFWPSYLPKSTREYLKRYEAAAAAQARK